MKTIIKNLLVWLFGERQIIITKETQRRYKSNIKFFFEGIDNMVEPMVDIPISNLGITYFEFKCYSDKLILTITLERPGLLIGKAGRTINELEKFLSTRELKIPVKINIKESKIWW